MRRLIIWGAGELGSRVARLWQASEGQVFGYTKTNRRHQSLKETGVVPLPGNPAAQITAEDVLLLLLPGHAAQQDAVSLLVSRQIKPPFRVVMTSVTGYYGQAQGTINENTPVGRDRRSAGIAAAEQRFQKWAGQSGVILRLGGLYCDGRGPFSALARRGRVMRLNPPNKTMALIHYNDAAVAVYQALRHPAPESLYLTVTPPCPTHQEFYHLACQKLNLPKPEFSPPLKFPPVQYDVSRLRQDLLPKPAFPNWHAALIFTNTTASI